MKQEWQNVLYYGDWTMTHGDFLDSSDYLVWNFLWKWFWKEIPFGTLNITQGLANYSPPANLAHLPFLSIKFYWNTDMPIYLCIICGCFWTTMTKLNSCDQDHMAQKRKIFTVWLFTEKKFANPGLINSTLYSCHPFPLNKM